jgi:hypothetical protein
MEKYVKGSGRDSLEVPSRNLSRKTYESYRITSTSTDGLRDLNLNQERPIRSRNASAPS